MTITLPRPHRYLLISAILLLAVFLRTYHLDGQALRGDEAATVLYSAMPVTELWELSRVTDPHPPLYYLMLHPWQRLLSEAAWPMRFAGVAASVLAVAALYALTRRTLRDTFQGDLIALLAALLLAINPLQIWLAQDVRSYPFFTLLGLLSSMALWAALHPRDEQPSALRFGPYVLLTVASLYIHYYTVFLIAFQGLFVLLNARRFWKLRWHWLTSQIAILLLIIPGLQLAYNFIGQAAGGIETLPTLEIFRLASTALLTGFTIEATWGIWLSLLLAPVWLIGLVTLLRNDWHTGTFWLLFFLIPVAGVIALSIGRPFFKERFLIQAQPAFALLLAVGFVTLWKITKSSKTTHHASRLTVIFLAIFLLTANYISLANYFAAETFTKAPPWQLYREYVSDHAQSGDVMLTNFPEASVSYYSPNDLPFYVVPVERDRSLDFRLEETQKIAQAYERVWFLPLLRQGFDEQGDVLAWLDRHGDRVDQVFFPIYNVNLYLTPPTIEARMIPHPRQFEHGIHLRGYQIFNREGESRLKATTGGDYLLTLEPEEAFTLSLYWEAEQPPTEPYTVFTHLVAADGFNRTSHDNQPVWGTYPTTQWSAGERVTDKYTLTIPAGTPPGDHRLRIGWYHAETQQPVFVSRSESDQDNAAILDVIIRVEPPKP